MLGITMLISSVLTATSVTIAEPVDGETYDGDWLPLKVIVENENTVPDSVHYTLNSGTVTQIPRLNTDWDTYMRDNSRRGSTEAPGPLTSDVLWTANVTGTYHEFISPIIVDGRLYHASEDQETAFCLDAATGEILWSFPGLGDPIDDALAYDNGYVYVVSDSVWCLDALTGEKVWSYLGHEDHVMAGPPAIRGGILYSEEWKQNTSYITALNSATGAFIWEKYLPTRTASTLTVTDDLVLVPTANGPLYALSRADGEIVWEYENCSYGFWDTSPVVVDETVFIGGFDGVNSLDLSSGSPNWKTDIGGRVECTPCYYEGNLYVGAAFPEAEKKTVCLDSETGSVVWQSEGGLHASMGAAGGYLYWGDTWDGTINCTDASSGELVWSYPTNSSICGIVSSPAIVDGVMFIAATDSCLYAFGAGFKYTYREDFFYADIGDNELIVTSWDGGESVAADTINFTVTETGTALEPSRQLSLSASPNPLTRSTASISFDLAEPGLVSLKVFDLAGRTVVHLIDQEMVQGEHSVQWNGQDQYGEEVSAGLYLCRMEADGVTETTGLCLLK